MSTVNKIFSTLCAAVLTIVLLASCGTTQRSASPEPPPPPAPKIEPPETQQPVSIIYQAPDSSLARVLISRDEGDTEIVELLETGRASWYGPNFHGRLTANGEQYNMNELTAAHRTLPFNTRVLVQNEDSGQAVLVRINDRGPYAKNRIIDLSREAAKKVGMIGPGVANVRLYVPKNSLEESQPKNLTVPTYTVQLGSFDSADKAFKHSKKIDGSRVEIIRRNNKTFYRVYYGLYENRNKARQKQKELERRNFSGYVKQLENG